MAKTLVAPAHEAGPLINGGDGCYARTGENGMCPGVKLAEWLNSMGEDEDRHSGDGKGGEVTCGQVRDNWLRNGHHIVAVEPELAQLRARERQQSAELRRTKRNIKRLLDAKEGIDGRQG